MGIHILSSDVINQIAAGEVLERPSSLAKELIENSIDAGATEIEIDLDLGGRNFKITDNGSGVSKDDLRIILQRHSTSKIQQFSDLWALQSYGFRGEALASTASVSRMRITSRRKDDKSAHFLSSEFGQQQNVEAVGGGFGTQIQIEDLFENVPARLKFLKTEGAEISQILKVVKSFALTHPLVSFKVKQRGVMKVFYPPNQSHVDRAKFILGVSELFEASQEYSQMKARIFFSSPNQVQKTTQNIWIFVQKRWIQDRGMQKAILDAYRNLLMHGEYPSCVVHLDCDPQIVDVNIHPTKSQVKFQDSSQSFRIVYHTLRSELEKAPWLKNLFNDKPSEERESHVAGTPNHHGITTAVETFSETFEQNEIFQSDRAQFKQKSNFDNFIESQGYNPYRSAQNFMPSEPQKAFEDVSKDPMWGSLQVLSQLNLTYILAQSRSALFLVDQHAAHERVNFEKLMKSFRSGHYDIQSFLIPLSVDFDSSKIEDLLKISGDLKKLGVEIEQSGPQTLSIISAPHLVKEKALVEMLHKISAELDDNGGSFALDKILGDIFATMACHSSVRAGQALSTDEMKELLEHMDEFPLSSFCPHGRPVFKQILFRELDRDFGRIV